MGRTHPTQVHASILLGLALCVLLTSANPTGQVGSITRVYMDLWLFLWDLRGQNVENECFYKIRQKTTILSTFQFRFMLDKSHLLFICWKRVGSHRGPV